MAGIDIVLRVSSEGPWTVVDVDGEIDLSTAPGLRERIIELVEEGRNRLLVDVRDVELIDSTGLGVLVGSLKRVREHDGTLALVCPGGPVLRVLRLTGLDRVLAIYDSVADAVAAG